MHQTLVGRAQRCGYGGVSAQHGQRLHHGGPASGRVPFHDSITGRSDVAAMDPRDRIRSDPWTSTLQRASPGDRTSTESGRSGSAKGVESLPFALLDTIRVDQPLGTSSVASTRRSSMPRRANISADHRTFSHPAGARDEDTSAHADRAVLVAGYAARAERPAVGAPRPLTPQAVATHVANGLRRRWCRRGGALPPREGGGDSTGAPKRQQDRIAQARRRILMEGPRCATPVPSLSGSRARTVGGGLRWRRHAETMVAARSCQSAPSLVFRQDGRARDVPAFDTTARREFVSSYRRRTRSAEHVVGAWRRRA